MGQGFSILWVAAGGALGSVGRYGISTFFLQHVDDWRFPFATFTVNVVGCLVIGILGGLATKQQILSPELQLFLITGVMGGFTTFSSFGLETFDLLRRGEVWIAGIYIIASIVLGLLAAWLGFSLISGKVSV